MAKRKTPREILKEFRRKQQNGLYAVAVELTGRAKRLATKHHDVGTRRNSITQTKSEDGRTVLWGIPVKAAPHAPHLELGFKPHWVPAKYIGVWMQRKGAGVLRHGRQVKGKLREDGSRARINLRARGTSVSMGLFVGGPGSTLDYARGGARGRLFGRGGKLRTRTYKTKGTSNRLLPSGTVGHPILQPVGAQAKDVPLEVYRRGFERGR